MKNDTDKDIKRAKRMVVGASCITILLTILINAAWIAGIVALCAFIVGKIFGWC